jgi:hypothetical protein
VIDTVGVWRGQKGPRKEAAMNTLTASLVVFLLLLGGGVVAAEEVTGKAATCTGVNPPVALLLAEYFDFTDTMSVVIPSLKTSEFLKITSTIQCQTDFATPGFVRSRIRIVDGEGNEFFASPHAPSHGFASRMCAFDQPLHFVTAMWWFNPAEAPGFASKTDVTVTRQDASENGGGTILFRTMCVERYRQ